MSEYYDYTPPPPPDGARLFTLAARGLVRDGRKGFLDSEEGQLIGMTREYGGFIREMESSPGDYAKAWLTRDGRKLSKAWLEEAEVSSLYDLALPHAVKVPRGFQSLHIATGSAAGPVEEAAAKLATELTFNTRSMDPLKAAGIAVLSNEMIRSVELEGVATFMQALRNAVTVASNTLMLQAMGTPDTVTGTGSPEADLAAALAAAADSRAYVVAAPAGVVRELALRSDGRMGVAGGQYVPGVYITPSAEVDSITVIPAGRLVIADLGLVVRGSDAATVTIDDEEQNLFQRNKSAMLAERLAYITALSPAVQVTA